MKVRSLPLLLVLLMGSTLLAPATPAAADDGSFDLTQVGIASPISLGAPPSETTVSVPLTRGLAITRLTGTLGVGNAGSGGRLVVSSGAVRLGEVDLPARPGGQVKLDLDLGPLKIGTGHTEDRVELTFAAYAEDGRCLVSEPGAITLSGLRITTTGEPARPTSIADFMPPTLERLVIVVPSGSDPGVAASAVRLAGLMAIEYPLRTPRVDVVDQAPDAAAEPNERIIEFSAGGEPSVELASDTRRLVVNGSGDALREQVDVLTSPVGILLSGRRATVSGALTPRSAPATQTLADLDQGGLVASGRGSATVPFGLDATALGAVPAAVDLHLVGTATAPVTVSGADPATLSLRVGDRVLESWSVSRPQYDVTARIPAELLGRYTSAQLVLTAAGAGACDSRPVVDLSLASDSTATIVAAEAPQTRGFADLPAALQPGYQIATDLDGTEGIARAARMATALQSLSRTPLDPQLVDVAAAVGGTGPAVLLLSGPVPAEVPLTVRDDGGTLRLPDGTTITDAGAGASFQVRRTDQRFVAVLSPIAGGDVTPLFDALVTTNGLGSLDGDVAVLRDGQVRTLSVGGTAVSSPSSGSRSIWIVLGSVAVALVAGGAVALAMLARRRRRA